MNKRYVIIFIYSLIMVMGLVAPAWAQHKGINFQAVIKKPDGTYPNVGGISVTAQILDPVNDCVLREEVHSGKNITNGYLNLVLGDASASTPGTRNPAPVLSITEVMNNSVTRTGLKCVDQDNNIVSSGQSYVPSNVDRRVLRVRMNIQGEDVVADFNMRAVGFAVNSELLNGKTESDFINVNSAKGVVQTNVESIFERFTKLDALLNNSNPSGTALGVNITGNAATATSVVGGINSLLPTQATNAGKYLKTDGTNVTWETAAGSSGLTQVGIDLPTSVFTNGTDITANGKVTATFAAQNAKTFFAGPSSGSAVPSFRALTTGDIGSFNTDVNTLADARIAAITNTASGIAGLDASTKIPLALLPNEAVFSSSVTTGILKLTGPTATEIQLSAPTSALTSYNLVLPDAGSTVGKVLKVGSVTGSTMNLVWDDDAKGLGTLSSVGLTLPTDLFTVTSSPLTANGDIVASLKSQTQKRVLAAPNAADGVPAFRQLLVSDISNAKSAALYDVSLTGYADPTQVVRGDDTRLTDARAPIDGSVTTAKIVDSNVTDAKIQSLAATKLTGTVDSARLPAASGTADGIVNQVAQSFAGIKTFINNVFMQGTLSVTGLLTASGGVSTTTVSASGAGQFDHIKLASSATTCDGTKEGAIRYNSTSKKMEFCNGSGWLAMTVEDPCLATPAIGTTCNGGALYLGQFDGGKYMVTPSGCTNSTTPTCAGGTDTTTRFWNDGTTNWVDIPGVETFTTATQKSSSSYRGNVNTDAIIAQHGTAANAAKYCQDMDYGGYSDWYLPSKSELAYMYCKATPGGTHNTSNPQEEANCVAYGGKQSILTGFAANYYWSSTEYTNGTAWLQGFNDGNQLYANKRYAYPVRCLRRY